MGSASFPDKVHRTAERYGMDLRRPLALVSGGPDSVALLRVVVSLGGEPVVLHVDHGLRGEESHEDAEFVSELCRRLNVRCEVRRLSLEGSSNLQERARDERYRLAEEVAARLGLAGRRDGPHRRRRGRDRAYEPGAGHGPARARRHPARAGRVQRPLIGRTRREILDYLREIDQPYRTDPTNLTGKYARNRVRLEVLPVLEELYPAAAGNIARAASLVREDLEVLEELAAGILERRGEEVVLPLDGLMDLRPALRRHAVRLAYTTVVPDTAPLPSNLIEAVLGLLEGGEGTRTLDLPGGVVASGRSGEELAFYRGQRSVVSGREEIRAGEAVVFGGWRISAREVSGYDPSDAARPEVAYLDAGKGPYQVRMAREGDIIRPLGLGGTKKVFRAMMDRKVPSDLRRRTPVVVDGRGEVAWIVLGELDERYKVDERTEKVLRLEVARIS